MHRPHEGRACSHTARLMVFKLVMAASRTWRRLQGQTSCRKSSTVYNSKTELKSSPNVNPLPDPRWRHRLSFRIAPSLPGFAPNRQSDPVPPQRQRVVAGLIFPSTRFGISLDAQFADKRIGLCVYPFSCLAAAAQPGEHFRPFSSEGHAHSEGQCLELDAALITAHPYSLPSPDG